MGRKKPPEEPKRRKRMQVGYIKARGLTGEYKDKNFLIKIGQRGIDSEIYCNGREMFNVTAVTIKIDGPSLTTVLIETLTFPEEEGNE